jgi:hypothetical protein
MLARNLLLVMVGLSAAGALVAQERQPLVRQTYAVADLLLHDSEPASGDAAEMSLPDLAEVRLVNQPRLVQRVRTMLCYLTLSEQQYQRLVDDGWLAAGGVTHLGEPALESLLVRCQDLQAVSLTCPPVLDLAEGQEQTRTIAQARHFVTGCQVTRGQNGGFVACPTIEAFEDKLGLGVRFIGLDADDQVQLEVRSVVQMVHEDHWHRLQHHLPPGLLGDRTPVTQYLQNPLVSRVSCRAAVRLKPGQACVYLMDGTILRPLPALPAWMAVGLGIDPLTPIRQKVLLVVRACLLDE